MDGPVVLESPAAPALRVLPVLQGGPVTEDLPGSAGMTAGVGPRDHPDGPDGQGLQGMRRGQRDRARAERPARLARRASPGRGAIEARPANRGRKVTQDRLVYPGE